LGLKFCPSKSPCIMGFKRGIKIFFVKSLLMTMMKVHIK
jgi:hypothetical protein